jgi:hypothetical protein
MAAVYKLQQLRCRAAGCAGGWFFSISELQQAPARGVGRDMVRPVLREQQAAGVVECLGRGAGGRWAKKDSLPSVE